MESPLAVANYFIKKSFDEGMPLTPMKLVKLVYIAHGWYLGLSGNPLLNEPVQAWQYGPVVKSVYDNFKIYGSKAITSLGHEYRHENGVDEYYYVPIVNNEAVKQFLDKVWEVYKKYSGIQLSTLTHQTDTPWYKAWHDMNGRRTKNTVIANDIIRDHYKSKISKSTTPIA